MNYLKLKQKIYEAIERNPLDRSAYEEMFAVCREYEKIDFQTAHAWNHELRNHISWGLRMTVSCQKFDEAREFDDLMFRSLLFGAQHFFDDYLQAVEYGKPLDKKFYQPRRHYLRRYVDAYQEILDGKLDFLSISMPKRAGNRSEISYLWSYYKGRQPILNRVKEVRPEITNKIVENRANEIVSFKSGYLMGEPLQYVSRGNAENIADAINQLNEFVFAEEKPAKDKELADWFHICGTSFRMVLPDEMAGEDDESPFEIYTLDPRNTFVVYNNGLGNKPILGVKYVVDENGVVHYSCYSDHEYFEIVESKVVSYDTHILGEIPIIEYPLNMARIGAFELVIPLLDAINLTDSNRLDGVEQFIQALMLFHNVDISSEDFDELRERGAIKFKDIDPQLKAEINYLVSNLNQGETQTLVDHMYQTVLTICGMPNRNGGSSTSDTGSAVIMRDGWSAAEARAKDSELMFKKSERIFLKVVLNICRTLADMDLKVYIRIKI